MSFTPGAGRRSGLKRKLCAADVAETIMMEPCTRQDRTSGPRDYQQASPRSRTEAVYRPNQSIYDGDYQAFADDSGEEQENYPPLASSSRYNVLQGHHSRSIMPPECVGPSSAEIVTMIQEQQQLLHQVLEAQKRMQLKQDEFDVKLQELAKRSESSSSSPDVDVRRKKFKISRDLTVRICNYATSACQAITEESAFYHTLYRADLNS